MDIVFLDSTDYDLLAELDKSCFPIDEPALYGTAKWFVGYCDDKPVCFCGWKESWLLTGFHYRAGVLPEARGNGLQRRMILMREQCMINAGLKQAVTYTDADAEYSMQNLIMEGYFPYAPNDLTRLSGPATRMGRVGFVHWRKGLV